VDWVNIKAQYMGDAPSHNASQQARSCSSSHCTTPSTLVIFDTMHSPLSVSRALLLCTLVMLCSSHTRRSLIFFFQDGIYISNIGSIAILWPVYMGFITESKCFQSSFIVHAHQFASAFLVLSAVLSVFALSVFPIV
jgi:hypothetical protein